MGKNKKLRNLRSTKLRARLFLDYNGKCAICGDDLETVDWDVKIEQLPPRPSRQIVVKFIQGSYRPPCINKDPDKE